MDSISEARLKEIHPYVASKVKELADRLLLEIIEIRVVQGLRTYGYQAQLYEQGRSTPGNIVTNCKPGHSYHNFGLAVDVCPFVGGKADWDDTHPAWKRIADLAVSIGFVAGANFQHFVDKPHLQMTGKFPVNPTDEVRQLFDAGGIVEVWKASELPDTLTPHFPIDGVDT